LAAFVLEKTVFKVKIDRYCFGIIKPYVT